MKNPDLWAVGYGETRKDNKSKVVQTGIHRMNQEVEAYGSDSGLLERLLSHYST